MKKIIMLAGSNIRKNKGAAVSLVLLMLMASMLLNLGLMTLFNFGSFFDTKAQQLGAAHAVFAGTDATFKDSFETYFKNYKGVAQTEKSDAVFLSSASMPYGKSTFSNTVIVQNADEVRKISPFTLSGDSVKVSGDGVYLPDLLRTGGGYKLGEAFVLNINGKEYTFHIAGFTEDIMLGSVNAGAIGIQMPNDTYQRFEKKLGADFKGKILSARFHNPQDAHQLITDFQKENHLENPDGFLSATFWVQDITLVKTARTATADIASMIIVAFAGVIILIGLIVIKFRVNNSIEDSMTDIGALKAAGYTSRQIIASLLAQFLLLAMAGGAAGVLASYVFLPALAYLFSAETGLTWTQGFDPMSSVLSFVLILLAAAAVTLVCARKIRSLHPIAALRGGITTHSFRRNPLPLERTRGNLSLVLALKMTVRNFRQNISIALIVAAITFGGVFALVMYYNICYQNDAFVNMVAGESCSVSVMLNKDSDHEAMLKNVKKTDGVRKVLHYDRAAAAIQDAGVKLYIAKDFSQTENSLIYEGRSPKHENEVAIGTQIVADNGKQVGDFIKLKMAGKEKEYLITGFIQSASSVGSDVEITYDGVRRMQPDYQWSTLYVYLEDNSRTDDFIKQIKSLYGGFIANTVNFEEMMHSQTDVYVQVVTAVVLVILAITALVIFLILYLVVKTIVLRMRRELGTRKAVGFCTLQLMNQISLSFVPMVLLGALLGGTAGIFGVNPLLSVMFGGIGIMRADFYIPVVWIAALCIGVCVFAYITAMAVSWRVRRISPYLLISE